MSRLELGPIPHRPFSGSGRAVYDNITGVLDEMVVDALVHNQGMFATHQSRLFNGSVYCYTDSNGLIRWCEEVWVGMDVDNRYRGTNLDKLIAHVIDIYGDV